MTTTHRYPSAQFPLFPAVALSTPDGWTPATVPGGVLAVRADSPSDRFAPNVVVTIARYTTDFDGADALSLLRDGLRGHPDAKVDAPFTAAFGEERYLVVNVAFDDAVAGTLVQVHAYCAFPVGPDHPEHNDVVHVMGTCAAVNAATDYPLLQQVMESLRVDREAGAVLTADSESVTSSR